MSSGARLRRTSDDDSERVELLETPAAKDHPSSSNDTSTAGQNHSKAETVSRRHRPKTLFLLAALACIVLWACRSDRLARIPLLGDIFRSGIHSYPPDASGKYTIESDGIEARFVPYGAAISNLFINDAGDVARDIVLGWDDASYYTIDPQQPYYGSVPGRYANRIKNSSFVIDEQTYHVLPNENDGANTLHGGPGGWSLRNWTVVAHTKDSIAFELIDEDGSQGFPGRVVASVNYTVSPYAWHISMSAISTTKKTPIMLSSHTYWNLDGFANPTTPTALEHTLSLPYSRRRIGTDSILVPTGEVPQIDPHSVNDFYTAAKRIGANMTSTGDGPSSPLYDNCGEGCTGYDTCFLIEREWRDPWARDRAPAATLSSAWSGIRVDVFTDQRAVQVYSCNGQDATAALKETQGLPESVRPRTVPRHGCVVLEVEDWLDGINHPEWEGAAARQIFGPDDEPYALNAVYRFGADRAGAGG